MFDSVLRLRLYRLTSLDFSKLFSSSFYLILLMSLPNTSINKQTMSNFHSFDSSINYYLAMTLNERLASLRTGNNNLTDEQVFDRKLAHRRLERWKSEYPFSNNSYFNRRLATEQIQGDELEYLLGESTENLSERTKIELEWLKELKQVFSTEIFARFRKPLPFKNELRSGEIKEFLEIIAPIIDRGREKLRQGIQKIIETQSCSPFELTTVENLFLEQLPDTLLRIITKTLVLEMNVARLQGTLKGNTSEERFQSFLDQFCQPNKALQLFEEYPVLARQLTQCINQWVNFSLEFLQNLCLDLPKIQSKFDCPEFLGLLVELHGNIGDSHHEGRAVLSAKFSSGFQIVYKPRSLALDIHFQELLSWINTNSNSPDFKTLKTLDCETHGWVEYVFKQTCHSEAEIQRFYQRQGGYLALLYTLEASDFHFDNLIAMGEHPVLVDLEALFHPHLPKSNSNDNDAHQIASDGLNYSVLKIGLLPQRLWSNDDYEGIDLSGLGTGENQLSPDRIPYWKGAKTDEMKLDRCRMEINAEQHKVTLNNVAVDVLDYQEFILEGFTSVYQLLKQHQEFLLSPEGILTKFVNDETRVLVRSSRTYALLLQESYHPDVLRNALDRDRLFDSIWAEVARFPYLSKVIPAELEDLQHGDIPKFTTHPNSRHLWSTSGKKIINFFDEPAIDTVRRRLQKLSNQDLRRQIWYIKASFTTLITNNDRQKWSSYSLKEPKTIVNSPQLLEMAKTVANHLESLALRGEDDAAWLGIMFKDEKHSSIVQLSYDLYDGIPGLCLFFAYLGEVTQEQRYKEIAQAGLVTLRKHIKIQKSDINSIGSFNGWGGIIYTLTHLSKLWQQPDLLVEAESIVNLLPTLIEQDDEFDIIGGAAGCILALTGLYKVHPSTSILQTAIQCGNHLLDKAQLMENGIGWLVKNSGDKPLSGFSHGSAGIACALLELSVIAGEQRFQKAALDAIEYERTLFCTEAGNWLDLRLFSDTILKKQDKSDCCNSNWCHGAPGIGLARLRSLKYLDNSHSADIYLSEINTALKTTVREGFGQNHCLCHGDLGNLDLLLQASLDLNDNYWTEQVTHFSSIIAESIEENGWLCGVPLGVETPGLMTGLAGIGYQLLRLTQPELIPSVLLLESPKI